MLTAAQAEADRQSGIAADGPNQTRRGDLIKILNNTGSTVGRYGVMGLDAPIITPYDTLDGALREVTFLGVIPTVAHKSSFAVMHDSLNTGQIGRGYVAGTCWVQVDVLDVTHRYAESDIGDVTRLISVGDGAAQILWKESDTEYGYSTGLQWAVVRLGKTGPQLTIAQATGPIGHALNVGPYGAGPRAYGTGPAVFQVDNGTQVVTSTEDTETITVKNLTNFDIVTGTYMIVGRVLGSWWVIVPDMCADINPYSYS